MHGPQKHSRVRFSPQFSCSPKVSRNSQSLNSQFLTQRFCCCLLLSPVLLLSSSTFTPDAPEILSSWGMSSKMSMTFLCKNQPTDFILSISAPVLITQHHKQPKILSGNIRIPLEGGWGEEAKWAQPESSSGEMRGVELKTLIQFYPIIIIIINIINYKIYYMQGRMLSTLTWTISLDVPVFWDNGCNYFCFREKGDKA